MAKVLAEMGTDKLPGIGASIIGVSEVENSRALDALIAQQPLRERGFRYAHIEGPDKRGVDCALLYNPAFFTPDKVFLQPYVYENGDTTHATRGFLTVQGTLAEERLTVIVCHWPSRAAEGKFRDWGGKQVGHLKSWRPDCRCRRRAGYRGGCPDTGLRAGSLLGVIG